MIIIGAGRIGGALARRAEAYGVRCHLITRHEGWQVFDDERSQGPILVATRNDDLAGVVARVPPQRRADLVFVQNGMLDPWLKEQGLEQATRGLLYFAVPTREAEIQPGEASPFSGVHSSQVVNWLGELGLSACQLTHREFALAAFEKLLWNVIFGTLCPCVDAPVDQLSVDRREQVDALVQELSQVGQQALGLTIELDAVAGRLCDYSASLPGYRARVSEWPWRNGWFLKEARERGIRLPLFEGLIAAHDLEPSQ